MDKPFIQNAELLTSALAGLGSDQKYLESKWFYDSAGSVLFEKITRLPEYYPTRTELKILREQVAAFDRFVPEGAVLVELGSGASTKTRILLDHMQHLAAYIPMDISEKFLKASAQELAADYPQLPIDPLVADFTGHVTIPDNHIDQPLVAFFPGSTIGNLDKDQAMNLLARVGKWGNVAAFIVGIDLVKSPQTLIAAYDDAQGVTAAFNKNILRRLNDEIGAQFDLDQFDHEARWNADLSRMEMHLVSKAEQLIPIGSNHIQFGKGETIHTENSHKYTRESFSKIAARGGWSVVEFLTDDENLFGVAVLTPGR